MTARGRLSGISVCGLTIKPKYDILNRHKGKELLIGGEKIADEERVYRKIGDRATDMPSAVYFGSKETGMYALNEHVKYAYDEKGNIQKIFENGEMTVRYGYDTLGRLVREDNKKFGKTWLYAYDNNGNILLKRETDFTLKTNVEELSFTKKSYAYDGNKLVSYNGETCAYNGLGNPTTYRGKATAFTMGGYLTKYDATAFTYDMQGRRLTKNALSFTYDSNGKLVAQSDGLRFLYDHTGVVGLKYNDSVYVYRKDAQGNIIAILDDTGKVVVRYAYDAWGKHTVEDISDVGLGVLNPFRYRGYYYDVATGLYYLNTRYYDPETGRFISPDGIEYLDPDTINGLNLYAYCGNDPVNRIDPNGNKWWHWLLGAVAIVAVTVIAVGVTALTGGTAGVGFAVALGALKGAVIGIGIGAVAGTIIGVVAGGLYSVLTGADFWSSVGTGALWGLGICAFAGATIGAIVGGISSGVQYGSFTSKTSLASHFAKHGNEFEGIYSTAKEYAKGAKYVIKNGTYISEMNGYIKFFGAGGKANYAFVGLTKNGLRITTYGLRSVADLARKIPWLII